MNASVRTILIVVSLLIATGGGWFVSQSLPGRHATPQYALRLPEPVPLPDFTLVDQDGEPLSPASLRGQWTLVFFGFTHCPDICPATLQILSAARQKLAENGNAAELPQILLISVDPDRDTPETLQAYTRHFGDGVRAATGPLDQLNKLTSALGIYFAREESDDENYLVAHSAHVIVIDNAANYHAVFGAPHSVEQFVADVPILTAAR